jgi:HlyD family secretion protein
VKIRKRWLWIGGAALVVLFAAVAVLRPRPAKSVQVAEATRQKLIAVVKAPAAIEPETIVNISAELIGRVVQLAVQEGQQVKRGQLLLRIDPASYEEQTRQAEALLAGAEARLRGATATWQVAKPNYERRKALFAQKLLSPGEMELAERDFQTTQAEYEAFGQEVSRARAALRAARDQLSKTVYTAPIDGVVTELNIEQGEIVMIGTMNNPGTRILSVADLDRMLAKADVDETDVVDLKLGQPAVIEIDAIPDTSFKGRVKEIAQSATRTGLTGSTGETDFEVKVLFDERVPQVRPGMTADVAIETAQRDSALSVPIQAVVSRSEEDLKRQAGRGKRSQAKTAAAPAGTAKGKAREKTGVFVLVGHKVEFREVTTGIASDTDIEISGSVKPGDKVVTGPYQVLRDLKPGTQVKVEKPGERAARKP